MRNLNINRKQILTDINIASAEWTTAILEKEREASIQQDILNSDQAQGDHSENAVYQSAKDALNLLNIELKNLNDKVLMYQDFVNMNSTFEHTDSISIGSTVRLRLVDDNKEFTILLVPEGLGSAKIGAVSTISPVGAALLGKKEKDILIVKTISGDLTYTIEEVL